MSQVGDGTNAGRLLRSMATPKCVSAHCANDSTGSDPPSRMEESASRILRRFGPDAQPISYTLFGNRAATAYRIWSRYGAAAVLHVFSAEDWSWVRCHQAI